MPVSTRTFDPAPLPPKWLKMDAAEFKAAFDATPNRFPAAEPSHIPSPETAAEAARVARKPEIRAKAKAAQWTAAIYRNWADFTALATTPEQKAQLDAVVEKILKDGPDFAKVRNSATFAPIPVVAYSKKVACEIMCQAREIERESYLNRAKGEHGGALGRMALQLLEWFCFVMWPKSGFGMIPCLTYLAKASRMSRTTAVEAIQTLERFGLLTIQRRRQIMRGGPGRKVVQATNAYVLSLPKGMGALEIAVSRKFPKLASVFSEFRRRPAISNEHYTCAPEGQKGLPKARYQPSLD